MQRLIERNLSLLRAGRALVARLDEDAYSAPVDGRRADDHGVGSQMRHVIEFYECLLAQRGTGRVDYDKRSRDARLERSRAAALARFDELIAGLESGDTPGADAPLEIRQDGLPEPGEETGAGTGWSSSLARELGFLASHTIHHFALIAALLRARGVEVPGDFGVAPSTLAHRSRSGRCAP